MINNTMVPSIKNINNTVYEEIGNQKVNAGNAQDKIANICFVSKQNETKIVTVEVHRSSSAKIAPPPQFANEMKEAVDSSSGLSSLSSAISEELKRRAEVKWTKIVNPWVATSNETFQKKHKIASNPQETAAPAATQQEIESSQKKAVGNTVGGHIHNILMDEFKKAHQKMFKNGYVENEYQQQSNNNKNDDETTKITALDNNERKLEVSRSL